VGARLEKPPKPSTHVRRALRSTRPFLWPLRRLRPGDEIGVRFTAARQRFVVTTTETVPYTARLPGLFERLLVTARSLGREDRPGR
jgi:hypothetical protein